MSFTPDLLLDLPPYEQASYEIQAVIRALAGELGRIEDARQHVLANFFPTTADDLLTLFEDTLGLPAAPLLSLTQRRNIILAFLQSIKLGGSGLAWQANITKLIGPAWTYEEHIPGDLTSPPAYTLLIRIPYTPPQPPPSGLNGTPNTASGTLPPGTYYYAVSGLTPWGETLGCTPVSVALSATGKIALSWAAESLPVDAYNVYRGLSATSLLLLSSVSATTLTDDGSLTLGSQQPPTVNTSGAPQGVAIQRLVRAITPAHLAIEVGYAAGFLVGISDIGISPL